MPIYGLIPRSWVSGILLFGMQRGINKKEVNMLRLLWIIAIILLIVWLLGWLITPFMGGFIHILIIIAVIFFIIWLVQRVRH